MADPGFGDDDFDLPRTVAGPTAAAAPQPAPVPDPLRATAHRARGFPSLVGVIALVIVVTAAAIYLIRTQREADSAGLKRIAVMPFENLSSDPANAYFADGIHEEILTALASGAPELEVVSRMTMMSYRGQGKAVRELARELEVTHLLAGTVRREARQVRVTLQLIDARTDRELWTRSLRSRPTRHSFESGSILVVARGARDLSTHCRGLEEKGIFATFTVEDE